MKTIAMVVIPQTLTMIGEYEAQPLMLGGELSDSETVQRYTLSNAYQSVMLNVKEGIAYQFIHLGSYVGYSDDVIIILDPDSLLYKQYIEITSNISLATTIPLGATPIQRKPH